MNRSKQITEETENPFALSIGDLMAALLLIFVLLLASTLLKLQDEFETKSQVAERYTAIKEDIYKELMIEFKEDGIRRIAEMAWQINDRDENIGARRLYTVMERLLEEVSYKASNMTGKNVVIDKEYVNKYLETVVKDQDLSKYIL